MADDIGYCNISAYNRGMMGYHTPNIDRIANEGAIFTDYYGQQSCTAGRAAFITGQSPLRTGLLKVGLPGARKAYLQKIRPSPSFSNHSNLAGLRFDQWKAVFLEKKAEGFSVWQQPMTQLRLPIL